MSSIELAARELVKARRNPKLNLIEAERKLDQAVKESEENRKTKRRFRELAMDEWHKDGEIEVDDDALVSISDDGGAYVAAWVWVYAPEAEFDICECGRYVEECTTYDDPEADHHNR